MKPAPVIPCSCGDVHRLVAGERKRWVCACGSRLMYAQGLARLKDAQEARASHAVGVQVGNDLWLPDLD